MIVYGVLLVGVLLRGVVWLMCFKPSPFPLPEGKKRKIKIKNKKLQKTLKNKNTKKL